MNTTMKEVFRLGTVSEFEHRAEGTLPLLDLHWARGHGLSIRPLWMYGIQPLDSFHVRDLPRLPMHLYFAQLKHDPTFSVVNIEFDDITFLLEPTTALKTVLDSPHHGFINVASFSPQVFLSQSFKVSQNAIYLLVAGPPFHCLCLLFSLFPSPKSNKWDQRMTTNAAGARRKSVKEPNARRIRKAQRWNFIILARPENIRRPVPRRMALVARPNSSAKKPRQAPDDIKQTTGRRIGLMLSGK